MKRLAILALILAAGCGNGKTQHKVELHAGSGSAEHKKVHIRRGAAALLAAILVVPVSLVTSAATEIVGLASSSRSSIAVAVWPPSSIRRSESTAASVCRSCSRIRSR